MRLFLSYTKEDQETAREIVGWLRQQGFEVYDWLDTRQRGGRFIEHIELEISTADAFLVLLSPNLLTSAWCQWERELAMTREMYLRTEDKTRVFIHVLHAVPTSYPPTGFLQTYDWFDLTTPADKASALPALLQKLDSTRESASVKAGSTISGQEFPPFQNRQDELAKVTGGLTNASGPHFWLVISPPQLGKSWFLRQLGAQMAPPVPATGQVQWETRFVDVHDEPLDVRTDATLLLKRLFGLGSAPSATSDGLQEIAHGILEGGKPYLCLLDSADLLEADIARTLRSYLSQIYEAVANGRMIGVRLGLVVASRHEDEWRPVSPKPRLATLPLSEFKPHVVRQALVDLTAQTKRHSLTPSELERYGEFVHRFSEGLPALLVRSLQWIQKVRWMNLERLESRRLFDDLAGTYIKEHLLSVNSLIRSGGEQLAERQHALEQAFRVLVPYRLFTQSHVRHHLGKDRALTSALDELAWRAEDLWNAISTTALLTRPLDQPWQEIHPAIRRLLYRYYYETSEARAGVHHQAREFVLVWVSGQSGTEQAVGLVECLWHEAAMLCVDRVEAMRESLCASAVALAEDFRPSPAYTPQELRHYAGQRMEKDEELEATTSLVEGLHELLVHLVQGDASA